MDPWLLSLTGFTVAMYITPGPNNVMVAASAANHGITATVPHMAGIVAGFSVMLTLVCAGLGSVLLGAPWLLPIFRWGGSAWMLWLAWKIASAPPPNEGAHRPVLGLFGAALFQWVNPKAWLIGVGAAAEFMTPHEPLAGQLLAIFVVAFLAGPPCLAVWAVIGHGAGRFLTSPGRLRTFNVAMALLLVASLVPILADGW